MKSELDMTPRYAPETVFITSGNTFGNLPVIRYIVHPANTHPKSPIKNDMVALECVTSDGSRWFGVESAYINSELKMVVVGTNKRDEVRMKWKPAKL